VCWRLLRCPAVRSLHACMCACPKVCEPPASSSLPPHPATWMSNGNVTAEPDTTGGMWSRRSFTAGGVVAAARVGHSRHSIRAHRRAVAVEEAMPPMTAMQ
jgi:hypothetical protein